MNVEVFSYTLIVAVLGMAVVFGFLWFLSLLMSLIKVAFGEKSQKTNIKVARTTMSDGNTPRWVVAAAAAYLIEEELEGDRSAEAWAPAGTPGNKPWVVTPRF